MENVRTVPVPIPTRNTGKGINDAAKTPQSKLLSWLAEEPDIYAVVKRYISADDFADPLCRKVAQILFAQLEEGRCDPAGIFSQIDDEEEAKFVAEALHQSVGNLETVQIRETALKDLMLNIKRLSLTRRDRSDNDFDTIIKIRKEIEQLERDRIILQ